MCIACVLRVGDAEQGGQVPHGSGARPGVLADWSPADMARAAMVYRQLPGWSRQLFDMLAAEPDRAFPISLLRTRLVVPGGQLGVEEICDWAAPICAAVGRHLPVLIQLSSGEPVCRMEQAAARLFRSAARPPARPEVPAGPGSAT